MSDLKKVKEFGSLLSNKKKYPSALKRLRGISDETKKSLLEVINVLQHTLYPQDAVWVECELIRRFLQPSPFLERTFEQIQGPTSVYELSHETYPHIFYLFGDVHFQENSVCPEAIRIDQYIKDTIDNSPVFIDVFVEEPYIHEKYFTDPDELGVGYLDRTQRTFLSLQKEAL